MAVSKIPTRKTVLWEGSSKDDKAYNRAITLSESYKNFDFLQISYKANVDYTSNIFDCKFLADYEPGNAVHETILYLGAGQYAASCGFKVTNDTTLTFIYQSNNTNFILGALKVVGIKL